jgi:molybdopterin-guanine dinucleotide biosynthesis protein A
MVKRAALILAGGRAQRFQTEKQNWHDKALAKLADKPLLIHAIENVQTVVEEIFVCVNDEERRKRYGELLAKNGLGNVRLVTDEKIDKLAGPIVAILTGLKSADADYCLTLPADMPLLKPQVADYMFTQAQNFDAVVPMWPNGQLETLITVLKRIKSLVVTETLCKLRRSRPMDIIRASTKTLFVNPLAEIQQLDPEMKSFVNINSPQDLTHLQTRQTNGPVKHNVRLQIGELPIDELCRLGEASTLISHNPFGALTLIDECIESFEQKEMFFWSALCKETRAKILLSLNKTESTIDCIAKGKVAMLAAAKDYGNEAQIYEKKHCTMLAERARADQLWCQSTASKV